MLRSGKDYSAAFLRISLHSTSANPLTNYHHTRKPSGIDISITKLFFEMRAVY